MRRACPVCGRLVVQSCYHDGEDVSAKELPDDQIRKLIERTIGDLEAELEQFRDAQKELS